MLIDANRPTSRVLALLELLQDRPGITGPALADALGVTTRTIRRYVTILHDMGIPVEPTTGRVGGYTLRRGFRMPPLMFSADEAIGLAVALLGTRTSNAAELPEPVANALGKIERAMPADLAARIATIREGATVAEMPWTPTDAFPNPTVLATLIQGSMAHQRIWIRYGRLNGDQTAREVDPFGVLVYQGRWYLHGYCHLRKDMRTFRADRVRRVDLLPQQFDPPAGLDIQDAIMRSLTMTRAGWMFDVEIDAPVDWVRLYIPAAVAMIEPLDADRTRIYGSTEGLEWLAWRLSELDRPLTVIEPPELGDAMRSLGERLIAMSDRTREAAISAGSGIS